MTETTIYQKINQIIKNIQYHDNPYDSAREHMVASQLTIIPSRDLFTVFDAETGDNIECEWVTGDDIMSAHHQFLTALFMITPSNTEKVEGPDWEEIPFETPPIEDEDDEPEAEIPPAILQHSFRPSPVAQFSIKERIAVLKDSSIKFIHIIKNEHSNPHIIKDKDPQHSGIITIDEKDIRIPLKRADLREIETVCGMEPHSLDEIQASTDKNVRVREFAHPIAVTTRYDDINRISSIHKVVSDFRNPAVLASFNTLYLDEHLCYWKRR